MIEDAHWADEATLDLLKFLGRRIQRTPSVLVITYRDDEVGTEHPTQICHRRFVAEGGPTSSSMCRVWTNAGQQQERRGEADDSGHLHH